LITSAIKSAEDWRKGGKKGTLPLKDDIKGHHGEFLLGKKARKEGQHLTLLRKFCGLIKIIYRLKEKLEEATFQESAGGKK